MKWYCRIWYQVRWRLLMSIFDLREKYLKALRERQEDVKTQMLNGVKDMSQYEFLRGRHSSLVDAESIFRELLGKEYEEPEQGGSP